MIRVVEGAPPAEGMRHRVAGVRHPQQGIARRARSTRRGRPVPCGGGRRETPRRAPHQSPPSASRRLGLEAPFVTSGRWDCSTRRGRAGRWARARNLVEGRCHVTSATCRVLVVGASLFTPAVAHACPFCSAPSLTLSEQLAQSVWVVRSASNCGPPLNPSGRFSAQPPTQRGSHSFGALGSSSSKAT